ncbi:MAG: hypothetical protein RJB38_1598 [Pseudomonadota bacterium]|jgi:hypothetical protein
MTFFTPRSLFAFLIANLLMGALHGTSAQAARFANQFVEFELPPRWQCNLEGAEWVCQSTDETRKRDAIIVLAAKLKGDQDSLDQYLNHLKSSKVYQSVQGRTVKSDPKYAKSITIGEHPWVDSLHLESELPGFYTRYVATVKQDIGVLVTFSINKDKYNQYLPDAENLVNTLKVFRKAGGINANPGSIFANTNIPSKIEETSVFPAQPKIDVGEKPKSSGEDLPLGLILVGAGAIGYLVWRRRQNSED